MEFRIVRLMIVRFLETRSLIFHIIINFLNSENLQL